MASLFAPKPQVIQVPAPAPPPAPKEPAPMPDIAAPAVVEARRKGVRCFCLSLDRASEADVRRIFGHAGYRIVDDPARLAAVLARSYAELAGG